MQYVWLGCYMVCTTDCHTNEHDSGTTKLTPTRGYLYGFTSIIYSPTAFFIDIFSLKALIRPTDKRRDTVNTLMLHIKSTFLLYNSFLIPALAFCTDSLRGIQYEWDLSSRVSELLLFIGTRFCTDILRSIRFWVGPFSRRALVSTCNPKLTLFLLLV